MGGLGGVVEDPGVLMRNLVVACWTGERFGHRHLFAYFWGGPRPAPPMFSLTPLIIIIIMIIIMI